MLNVGSAGLSLPDPPEPSVAVKVATEPVWSVEAQAAEAQSVAVWIEGVRAEEARQAAEAAWYEGVAAEITRQAMLSGDTRYANASSTFIQPEVRTGVVQRGSTYADAAECTRAHEGWYEANTGNGYYGAYQFNQGTWNNTVAAMGRSDLVGVRASDASPADQDAAFWYLWGDGAGASHWGHRCTEYAS
jgi:hypothetical protein